MRSLLLATCIVLFSTAAYSQSRMDPRARQYVMEYERNAARMHGRYDFSVARLQRLVDSFRASGRNPGLVQRLESQIKELRDAERQSAELAERVQRERLAEMAQASSRH